MRNLVLTALACLFVGGTASAERPQQWDRAAQQAHVDGLVAAARAKSAQTKGEAKPHETLALIDNSFAQGAGKSERNPVLAELSTPRLSEALTAVRATQGIGFRPDTVMQVVSELDRRGAELAPDDYAEAAAAAVIGSRNREDAIERVQRFGGQVRKTGNDVASAYAAALTNPAQAQDFKAAVHLMERAMSYRLMEGSVIINTTLQEFAHKRYGESTLQGLSEPERRFLVRVWTEGGRLDKLLQLAQDLPSDLPNNEFGDLAYAIGVLHAYKGDSDTAREWLQKVLHPRHGELHGTAAFRIAETHLQQGAIWDAGVWALYTMEVSQDGSAPHTRATRLFDSLLSSQAFELDEKVANRLHEIELSTSSN